MQNYYLDYIEGSGKIDETLSLGRRLSQEFELRISKMRYRGGYAVLTRPVSWIW